MAKTILRLTNKSASVKIADAAETITLGSDLKLTRESLSSKVPTAITWLAGVVTVTLAGHGFTNGGTVTVAGMTPANYNGTYTITVLTENTFTYPLVADPGLNTIKGTIGMTPKVSLYRVYSTGNFEITRNGTVVLKSTSGQMMDLDFSQFECVDNINSTYDIVVTVGSGVQVYLLMRKETGYVSHFQPEKFGQYDNETTVG